MRVADTELCIYTADSDMLCFSKKVYAAENLTLDMCDDIVSYRVCAKVASADSEREFLKLRATPALTVATSTVCIWVLDRLTPPLTDSDVPISEKEQV